MRAGVGARWCVLGALCSLLAARGAGRRRGRSTAQENNFKLIQNIKDKLVVSNEDYVPPESPEGEFNFMIGKTQVQLNGTIAEPELAHFDFNIGHPVAEHAPEKDPQSEAERKTMRREGKLALRLRQERKKRKETTITTQQKRLTTAEIWDPYTTEFAETKRVKKSRKDAPSKSKTAAIAATSGPWTALQLMNVDPSAGSASSIFVYNFYPITRPNKRANTKGRSRWTSRADIVTPRGIRKAMSLSEVRGSAELESTDGPREAEEPSVREEPHSGVVTFNYRAEIPVKVPLSQSWIANMFS